MSTDRPRTHIVAFGNQKGGVTKTSTVVNLAAALSEQGKKILVVDLDVNCGSTRLFGVPQGVNVYGTYEVMLGEESPQDVIMRASETDMVNMPENVHLIAAHTKLEGIDTAIAEKLGPFGNPHQSLIEPIQSLKGEYDYVFMDTSPSMTLPTKAAYVTAEYFVLTAVPERLAIEGLVNAIKYVEFARNAGNPDLRLMGVVMNQVPGKGTRLSRLLMDEVDKVFGQGDAFMRRYETSISTSTIVPTAQQTGQTLFEAAPNHKITQQYRELANEFEGRFELLDTEQDELVVEVNPDVSVPETGSSEEVINA